MLPSCQRGHCAAKLYLEGSGAAPSPGDAAGAGHGSNDTAHAAQPAKRRRIAAECLQELKGLKELMDGGLLTRQEFDSLKEKLLQGE